MVVKRDVRNEVMPVSGSRDLTLLVWYFVVVSGLFLWSPMGFAQFDTMTFDRNDDELLEQEVIPDFTWVRAVYTNYGGGMRGWGGRGGGWWDTDYPDSDQNFLRGVQRYTNINTTTRSYSVMKITSPELFEHTFLYINMKRVPIGSTSSGPNFSPEEVAALREFMFRGGFVMLNDFWGEEHWADFLVEINKLFPDRELVKLDTNHEVFHVFFDIDQVAQVPGRTVTWERNGWFSLDDPNFPPSVHAILDDDGRIMLVANYNTDLGDSWEHTFYEPFPTKYTNEAYKIGINFLIYAFSH